MPRKHKCKANGCDNTVDRSYSSTKQVCSVPCALAWGREKDAKKRNKAHQKDKEGRKQHKIDKERVTPRAKWYNRLQTLVNQYAVHVRDKGKSCCTCKVSKADIKYDAGHFLSRKAMPEMRFELTNIHKQCSIQCNQHGSGMRPEYIDFIKSEYGEEHYNWLIGPHPSLKTQFPDYTDVKKEIIRYRKLLRDNGLRPNT